MSELIHQGFTDLEFWKKARILKNEVKTLVDIFPLEEKYRLTDQLIRSSRCINAVVAEGYGRFTFKDQLHFCIIARGSLYETLNHLIDAFDCKFIDEGKLVYFKNMIDEIAKLLNGYINYLRKNLKNINPSKPNP